MKAGDIFAVMSDGIFESTSPGNEFFGQDRAVSILKASAHKSPENIIKELRSEVESFTNHSTAADDRTIFIIKRNLTA